MVRLRCDPWLEPIYRLRLLMPAEPHIRSPFPERLDTIIPHSRGHRARDGGPPCISVYHSHCLQRSARPDPTRLIRPRGTRDNDFGLLERLSLPSRSHPRGAVSPVRTPRLL